MILPVFTALFEMRAGCMCFVTGSLCVVLKESAVMFLNKYSFSPSTGGGGKTPTVCAFVFGNLIDL